MSFRLRTFGQSTLAGASGDLVIREPNKLVALLVYLQSAPARTATRDDLIDMLWADLPHTAARKALRQHLWLLHSRCGVEFGSPNRSSVMVTSSIVWDRDEFLAHVGSSDLESAAALYAEPFLPAFAASGSVAFEHWLEGERARLRKIFRRTTELLVHQFLSEGRVKLAVDISARLTTLDRFDPLAWGLRFEALAAAGDTLTLRSEVDAIEMEWKDEGLLPAQRGHREIVERARRLPEQQAAVPDEPAGAVEAVELVGRAREFAVLAKAWEASARRPQHAIRVAAPAGMGKTRLLQDFARRVAAGGGAVISVAASTISRHVPFALISSLARLAARYRGSRGVGNATARILVGLDPGLAGLFGDPSPLPPSLADSVSITNALRDLLAAVSAEQPMLVVIDDVHLADDASRAVLGALVAGEPIDRCLFVTAVRFGNTFDAAGEAHDLPLSTLAPMDIAELVEGLATLPVAPWAERLPMLLFEASGGVPLLVLEHLRLAITNGTLRLEDGQWGCPSVDALQQRFGDHEAIRSRLQLVPSREQHLLAAVALAGGSLSVSDAASALAASDAEIEDAAAALVHEGYILRRHDIIALAHDRFGEGLLALLEASIVSELAHRVGISLSASARSTRELRSLLRMPGQQELARDAAFRRRYVALARTEGDTRSETAIDAEIALAVSGFPLTIDPMRSAGRPRQRRLKRVLQLLVVATLAAGAGAWLSEQRTRRYTDLRDPMVLVRTNTRAGSAIRLLQWTDGVLRDRGVRPIGVALSSETHEMRAVRTPSGRVRLVFTAVSSDSGAVDLYTALEGESPTRLTSTPGDDVAPDLSPDGRFVVFSTTRWSRDDRRALAIASVDGVLVRRLTTAAANDLSPRWSPRGTLVAFVRRSWSTSESALCVIRVADGAEQGCRPLSAGAQPQLVGWESDSTMLAVTSNGRGGTLWRLDVYRERAESLLDGPIRCEVDGRARLAACAMRDGGNSAVLRLFSLPFRDPRPLNAAGLAMNDGDLVGISVPTADTALVRQELGSRLVRGFVGDTLRPHVALFDATGQRTSLRELATTVVDSTVVAVRDTVLFARRIGATTVTLRAGLTGADSVRIEVLRPSRATLWTESWQDTTLSPWFAFGVPRPMVGAAPDSLLRPNGDGRFESGVLRRMADSLPLGGWLQTRVRIPITRDKHQTLVVVLVDGVREDRLRLWDSRFGYPWGDDRMGPERSMCGLRYPASMEGYRAADTVGVVLGREERALPAPPTLASGRWTDVQIQVRADGTCALAIDGAQVRTSGGRMPTSRPVYVLVYGSSVDTDVRVGPLVVGAGSGR
jgi:DNA-binding SARP family transcriptional activator